MNLTKYILLACSLIMMCGTVNSQAQCLPGNSEIIVIINADTYLNETSWDKEMQQIALLRAVPLTMTRFATPPATSFILPFMTAMVTEFVAATEMGHTIFMLMTTWLQRVVILIILKPYLSITLPAQSAQFF